MKTVRKYLALLIVLILAAVGVSLTLKAGIGLGAFDAFTQTLAYTFDMRVGDIVTFLQTFFVLLQLIILRKDANWRILLQVPLAAILGQFINVFYYGVFGSLVLEGYFVRLIVFIFAIVWISFFISTILVLDLVTMPVESLCLVLSERTKFTFGQIRQGVDILLIVLALVFTFVLSIPLTIREGTLISALIFGPLLSFFMPKIATVFKKWKLIE